MRLCAALFRAFLFCVGGCPWVVALAAPIDPVPSLTGESARKIHAETWRRVRNGEAGDLLVEFRDPAIAAELHADLAHRRLRRMDAGALSLKRDSYHRLKTRNLGALAAGETQIIRDFSHLPMSLLRFRDEAALLRLLALPEVAAVYENRRVQPVDNTLDLIGQPQARQVLGHTGAGAAVVILDTGVDYTLASFGSCPVPLPAMPPPSCKVAAAFDLTLAYGNAPYPPLLSNPPYYPAYDDGSRDNMGHGTGVAATLLSAAPNAKIIAIDVMNEPPWSDFTGATTDALIAGIDWAIANQAAYNIAAINISLAGGTPYASPCAADNPLLTPVQQARDDHGILTVTASGNNGFADGILFPACTPGVVSVGAVYDSNVPGCTPGLKDSVTCFSNVSNYLSLLTPAGATSYAAPLVAGAVAVLAAAYPSESAAQRATRMTATGKPVTDNRVNGLGYVIPRLDMTAALLSPNVTPPANNSFAAATVLSGNNGTVLGWNFHATRESGEPLHAGAAGGPSLWWKWTATASGNVTLNTHGSNFDTLLNVYTGNAMTALTSVAANDNDGGDGGVSGLTFHADAGATYFFALDGKAGATGDLYLNQSFNADPPTTANLSITLTSTPANVGIGTLVTYTLTVHNSGPALANNVSITQTLPAGVSFVSADVGCVHSSGTVICTVGSLAAAGQLSREVRVTVNAMGSLPSQAQVTSTTADGNPADDSATASIATEDNGDVPLPAWALVFLAAGLFASLRRAR